MSPRWRAVLSSLAALVTVLVAMFVIGDGVGGRDSSGVDYDLISNETMGTLGSAGIRLSDVAEGSNQQDDAARAVEAVLAEDRVHGQPGSVPTVALASVSVENRDDLTDRRLWVVALDGDDTMQSEADPGAATTDQKASPAVVLVDPDTLVPIYWR